ncbi:MAG: hypothetical protein ACLFUJ_00880 [Phycisphaerae bacterium]
MPGLDWHGVEQQKSSLPAILLPLLVLLLLLLGIGAVLWLMGSTAEDKTAAQVNEAILAGNPQALLDRMSPELQKRVDLPVLAAWMHAASEHAEALRSGRVKFTFTSYGEKITGLIPDSGPLEGYKSRPIDDSAYRAQSRKLLAYYLTGSDAAASQAMPEQLLESLGIDRFLQQRRIAREALGMLQEIRFVETKLDIEADPVLLHLTTEITGSQGNLRAELTFQFSGFSGRLTRLTADSY